MSNAQVANIAFEGSGINVLSLFDGISCGRQALKELGVKVDKYYASEIDWYAIDIAMKNHSDIIQLAVKTFGLRDLFPKEKVNRIGCRDVNGKVVRKRGGNPTLFEFALQQLGESGDNVLAFGNEPCDSVAASKCGITAYNCLWGATDEDREVMLNDREHVCLSDPKEIIEILNSTCK